MNNDDTNQADEHVWECGWEDHEQKQLQRMAKLTFAQKLAWLEEAHRLVMHLEKSRQAGGKSPL